MSLTEQTTLFYKTVELIEGVRPDCATVFDFGELTDVSVVKEAAGIIPYLKMEQE